MLPTLCVQVMNALTKSEFTMDVVVRTYTGKGSKELFSLLEKHKTDLEKLMRSVKGFESYTLARSSEGEGGMSMTVCKAKSDLACPTQGDVAEVRIVILVEDIAIVRGGGDDAAENWRIVAKAKRRAPSKLSSTRPTATLVYRQCRHGNVMSRSCSMNSSRQRQR